MSTAKISHASVSNDSGDELESLRSNNSEVLKIDTKILAREKDQNGRTLMHKAAAANNLQTVKILMEIEPQLCLLRDNDSMTPLHLAVKNRNRRVIREIITGFPESLEALTGQQMTVFHLALENYQDQIGVVKVLLEEAKNHGKVDLFFKQDLNGNNIAHIAVSNRLVKIVQLLQSSTNDFTRLVNSLNGSQYTALDLHYLNKSSDLIARQIRNILWKAGALEAVQFLERSEDAEPSSPRKAMKGEIKIDERKNHERNVLLVVVGLLIATVYAALAGLPSFFPRENKVANEPFQFGDAVSGELPIIFYIILCLTVILAISMGYMIKLLYSLPFGNFLLLAMVAIFILYVLLACSIMPKLLVKVGSYYISSFSLMWILTSIIIFFGVVIKLLKVVLSPPKSPKAQAEDEAGSSKCSQSLESVPAVRLRNLKPSIRD